MPPHPDTPERLRAIERGLAARDWLGWERREAPAAEDAQLGARPHLPAGGGDPRPLPCGRWRDRRRHIRRRGLLPRRAARRAAAPARWSGRCWPARAGSASARCGPPATMPNPPGRWASACSTTSPSRRSWRSASSAASGCWSSTGTSTTATARPRFSATAPTCSSPASTRRGSTPAPARSPTPARARGGLHDQPPGAGRFRRGAVALAARAHRRYRPRPSSRPTWSWSRPASTRT